VTNEGTKKTEEWVKSSGAKFAYGYDKKSTLWNWFGVGSIPDSVLVDPSGTIVWRGHPMALTEARVEQVLDGALEKPLWDWPAEASLLKQAIVADNYALALREAKKLGGEWETLVTERVEGMVTTVETAHRDGDFLKALTAGQPAARALRGLPEGERVSRLVTEMKNSRQVQRIVAAQKKLAGLIANGERQRSRRKLERIVGDLEKLAREHEGTLIDDGAKVKRRRVERPLAPVVRGVFRVLGLDGSGYRRHKHAPAMEHQTEHRIAMWSGPRNISTAMMRAWENRPDTVVVDEPLYAHYLKVTGVDHPGREEIIAHDEDDWRRVADGLTGPIPGGPDGVSIHYQKHMAHHLLPEIDRGWVWELQHAFLLRDPREMLLSLDRVTPSPGVEDTGLPQQAELFDELCERTGTVPPVLDARDVLENPRALLAKLCTSLGVAFMPDAMLSWPAGPRASDGVWAKHWYDGVERTTGFQEWHPRPGELTPALAAVHEACLPYYERLLAHRLQA
jgi:hypothetical protein